MRKRCFIKGISILVIIGMLVGCSSAKLSSDMAIQAPQAESKTEAAVEEDQGYEPTNKGGNGDGIQLNTMVNINRKIIKTGNLEIETKAFDQTIQDVMKQAELLEGFMQDCTIQGDGRYSDRTANLTIRIPNETFDTFMNDTDHYGNVVRKAIEGQDVTDQYMDTEMRLAALEIQAERLTELLKQAGKLQDLFEIEKELANVTYEIETLKGSLKKYDSLIDYSTITIYVTETKEYQDIPQKPVTFGEKITNQFKKSLEAVGNLFKGLVIGIVAIIPFLIIIIPIGILCGILIKKRKKK